MPRTMTTSTRRVDADFTVEKLALRLADITTTAGTIFKFTPAKPGRIASVDWVTTQVGTGASATITFTPSVNGVGVQAGTLVVALADTAAIGQKKAGAAVTGLNNFDDNDEVGIATSATTVFTAGSGYLLLSLDYCVED